MKRALAILTVLLMLMCVNAYAETTDATGTDASVTQVTFDESTAAYDGVWLVFDEDGFMLYVPSDWVDVDVTDDMADAGTFYAGTSADGVYAMTVSYSADNDGLTTNDELAAQLTAAGYEGVAQANVNGIDVVGYDIPQQDVTGMAFMDGEGGMYVFSFTPASNETYSAVGQTIAFSLSPVDTDEAE